MKLSNRDWNLVERAKKLIQERVNPKSSVASCMITKDNNIYSGINIFVRGSAPSSMCAEYVAVGTMFTEGDNEVETIVSVHVENGVIPPCGQCRQLLNSFGNPYIIIEINAELKKIKLNDIYLYRYPFVK